MEDNFPKLIELSDRSFSNCGFAKNFEKEIVSSFDFDLTDIFSIRSISFGFALNRPDSRGGQENITLNILLNEDLFPILNHFQLEILARVHLIHKLMENESEEKEKISQRIISLRRFFSSIILAYQEIYGLNPPIMETPEIIGFNG